MTDSIKNYQRWRTFLIVTRKNVNWLSLLLILARRVETNSIAIFIATAHVRIGKVKEATATWWFVWRTCVVKQELDGVRFAFKHVARGVVILVRVDEDHAVGSTHRIHVDSLNRLPRVPNERDKIETHARSSAITDGPRDASCQSKSCQQLHNFRNSLHNKSQTNRSNGVEWLQSTDV